MAFGEDELVFKLSTSSEYSFEIKKILGEQFPKEELLAILEVIRHALPDSLGVSFAQSFIANFDSLASDKDQQKFPLFLKKFTRNLNHTDIFSKNLSQETLSSLLPHILASRWLDLKLGRGSEVSRYRSTAHNSSIDFVFKKGNKIIIKKLTCDEKTSAYHLLFHLCSISHSVLSLLKSNDVITPHLELANKLEEFKLYPYPNLYMFSGLKLPNDQQKKYKSILKKIL